MGNHKNLRIKSLRDNIMIGRFSALSVSKLVNITSYYNGKAYYYLMVKDGSKLNINQLDIKDTKELNGVEVKIPSTYYDTQKFTNHLKSLSFFGNIYVQTDVEDFKYGVEKFNNRHIVNKGLFKFCKFGYESCDNTASILIGNVRYNIDEQQFNDFYGYNSKYHRVLNAICPCFNVGELEVTPNREELLYNDTTIKIIKDKLEACVALLDSEMKTLYSKDYDNFVDYLMYEYLGNSTYYVLDDIIIATQFKSIATYKGVKCNESRTLRLTLNSIAYYELPVIATWDGDLHRGKYIKDHFQRVLIGRWKNYKGIGNLKKVVVLPSASGFSSKYLKGFLTETYGRESVVFINHIPFRAFLIILAHSGLNIHDKDSMFLIKEAYRVFSEISEYKDIMSSPEYLAYKKQIQAEEKVNRVVVKDITYHHTLITGRYWYKFYSTKVKSFEDIYKRFKSTYQDAIWVVAPYNDSRIEILNKMYENTGKDFGVLCLSQQYMKYVDQLNPRFKRIEDIVNANNPLVIKSATYYSILESSKLATDDMYNLLDKALKLAQYISKEDYKDFVKFSKDINKASHNSLVTLVDPKNYDVNMLRTYAKLLTYKSYHTKLLPYMDYMDINPLLAFIGMKTKLFRVTQNTYQQIKQANLKLW